MKNKTRATPNKTVETFANGQLILVVGSSWEQEEEILFEAFPEPPQFKIIIAPHAIERNIEIPLSYRSIKYSQPQHQEAFEADVLVIDNIGMLSTLYAMADIAFVGGGFRGALHNILEAAVFGIPVLYGPDAPKQPESRALQQSGGGFVVTNAASLKATINNLLQDGEKYSQAAKASQQFIESQQGATLVIARQTGLA